MPAPQLVLASSSPYRRQLLAQFGVDFTCAPPHIDESAKPGEVPGELALRLSGEKSRALEASFPDALIIGSDQVIVTEDGRILGKPGNHATATAQLQSVSGKVVRLITGIALLNAASGKLQLDSVEYEIGYRNLSDASIERYLQQEQPYDCAGALKSEGPGIALLSYMRGDDPSAVIGLPLIKLAGMLSNEGVELI